MRPLKRDRNGELSQTRQRGTQAKESRLYCQEIKKREAGVDRHGVQAKASFKNYANVIVHVVEELGLIFYFQANTLWNEINCKI